MEFVDGVASCINVVDIFFQIDRVEPTPRVGARMHYVARSRRKMFWVGGGYKSVWVVRRRQSWNASTAGDRGRCQLHIMPMGRGGSGSAIGKARSKPAAWRRMVATFCSMRLVSR